MCTYPSSAKVAEELSSFLFRLVLRFSLTPQATMTNTANRAKINTSTDSDSSDDYGPTIHLHIDDWDFARMANQGCVQSISFQRSTNVDVDS